MVVPAVIGLVRVGQAVYKVATSPAAQKMAQDLIRRFGAQIVKPATKATGTSVKSKVKNLTQGRYEGILKDKTPSLTSKVGGKVNKVFGGKPVNNKSPGVEKGTATVGKARQAGNKTGTKVLVGAAAVGGAIGKTAYDKLTEPQKSKFVKTDDGKYVPKSKTNKVDPRQDRKATTNKPKKELPMPKTLPKSKPKPKANNTSMFDTTGTLPGKTITDKRKKGK